MQNDDGKEQDPYPISVRTIKPVTTVVFLFSQVGIVPVILCNIFVSLSTQCMKPLSVHSEVLFVPRKFLNGP